MTVVKPQVPLKAMDSLALVNVNSSRIDLRWYQHAGANSYELFWDAGKGNDRFVSLANTTSRGYWITKLSEEAKTYQFKIRYEN